MIDKKDNLDYKHKIETMDYSEFVGLTRERNRPSGGIKTVHTVAVNAFINSSKKMLEIGSNTGFTSVNMSLLTGCKVTGIDLNDESVAEATRYAKEQKVEKLVSFKKANALNLPFPEKYFDVVWCSNVTSFVSEKSKAINEYLRVLKVGGTLVVVPIYYVKKPPGRIVQKISEAIGVKVEVYSKSFWLELMQGVSVAGKIPIELYYSRDFNYLDRKDFIDDYISELMSKEHLRQFGGKEGNMINKRLKYFMELFNENLKYAGFSIFLFQKRAVSEEKELFLTKKI